jgi:adenine-specific DNA-methyltransferase
VTASIGAADSPAARKARGAFFTPSALCRHVVEWAVRTPQDHVLEPSCGEAAFLLAAGERFNALAGSSDAARGRLDGIELHEGSARHAATLVRAAGHDVTVRVGDFFSLAPAPVYDAVIGNPPYVRYQDFSGVARARGRAAALRAGVVLTGLASSWAAFTVHAAMFLKPGGRLGLVLPAELLTVNYASEVRHFLVQRFARVRLVLFTRRVFPGVLEEVVLLLADGYGEGPAGDCELHQVDGVDDLVDLTGEAQRWTPTAPYGKWMPSLLSMSALTAYAALEHGGGFTPLQTWGETTLGMVTGNNRYFALSPGRARELGLRPAELLAISPPGSRHLRGLDFTRAARRELGADGAATLLFRPRGKPSIAGQVYIDEGEKLGVDEAYKCRVRSPWWRVPLVKPADLLLTYMNADTPRLCANRDGVHHLNSVHGVYLRDGLRQLGMDLLPLASLNSMTLVGAETVGRAYGGGMLKLEPKEADRLPVPNPATLEAARSALTAVRSEVAALLRRPQGLRHAVQVIDQALLLDHLGIPDSEVKVLREAHMDLAARRAARARSQQGS